MKTLLEIITAKQEQMKPYIFLIHLNQRGEISTLNDTSIKLVDTFTYLGSSVSSTEYDINMRLAKVWTAIDRLSVIWNSDLSDKIKRIFSKQQSYPYYYMEAPHWLSV